jgi:hypothetical protein
MKQTNAEGFMGTFHYPSRRGNNNKNNRVIKTGVHISYVPSEQD